MTDERLCKEVEQVLGRHIESPQDFVWLSDEVAKAGKGSLSVNTLKRLWGYLDDGHATRRSTLDIMAQFIGYRDYVAFCKEREEARVEEDNGEETREEEKGLEVKREEGGEERGKSRWNGALMAIMIVAVLMVGALFFLHRAPESEPIYVTDLSQLNQNKQYYIHTRNKARGSLGVKCRFLATTFAQAAKNRCDEPSTFAIIEHDGAYYLYSVKDRHFIDYGQCERDEPLASLDCAMDIHQETDRCFVFDFKACKTVCTLNINSTYGPHATNYGTFNEMFDDGNLFLLEEAGDFDPTEALAMLKDRPDPEYEAALKNITPGRYTIMENQRRLYLRADGYLTETLTDSCIFDINMVEQNKEESVPYRLPAWCITHQSEDEQKATAFGTPQDEVEHYVPHCGHLLVNAAALNSWQDKVFLLGSNGCYAIRATNIPIENWGANLYWTVYDRDGRPEADYSEERAYIWQIERVEEDVHTH